MKFPLPYIPIASYKGGNGFGGSRDRVRKGLVHAANDLLGYAGTPVVAMDDGVVINGPYKFFFETYAIEIRHPHFIARYAEIAKQTEVKVGDKVKEGQIIGYIGDQPGDDMLHLEFFSGRLQGNLSYPPGTHPPYDRRDDVIDGAKYLDLALKTRLRWDGDFKTRVDQDGRKYLETMTLQSI